MFVVRCLLYVVYCTLFVVVLLCCVLLARVSLNVIGVTVTFCTYAPVTPTLHSPCIHLLALCHIFPITIMTTTTTTEEAERSLHDALCVLTETIKETRVVCGGGCMEMLMAAAIDK